MQWQKNVTINYKLETGFYIYHDGRILWDSHITHISISKARLSLTESIFSSSRHCYHTFNWQRLLFFLQLELYTLGTSGSVGNGWNGDECMTDSPFPPSPVRSSNSSRNDHMGGKQFLPVSKWFQHCEVLSTNNMLAIFTSLSVQAMHDNLSSTTLQNIYDSKFKGWKLLRLHFLFGVLPNAIFNTSFLRWSP